MGLYQSTSATESFDLFRPDESVARFDKHEYAVGQLLHLSTIHSPELAKAWWSLASWCYRIGRKNLEALGCVHVYVLHDMCVILYVYIYLQYCALCVVCCILPVLSLVWVPLFRCSATGTAELWVTTSGQDSGRRMFSVCVWFPPFFVSESTVSVPLFSLTLTPLSLTSSWWLLTAFCYPWGAGTSAHFRRNGRRGRP